MVQNHQVGDIYRSCLFIIYDQVVLGMGDWSPYFEYDWAFYI
jgi:hypothetical protein